MLLPYLWGPWLAVSVLTTQDSFRSIAIALSIIMITIYVHSPRIEAS